MDFFFFFLYLQDINVNDRSWETFPIPQIEWVDSSESWTPSLATVRDASEKYPTDQSARELHQIERLSRHWSMEKSRSSTTPSGAESTLEQLLLSINESIEWDHAVDVHFSQCVGEELEHYRYAIESRFECQRESTLESSVRQRRWEESDFFHSASTDLNKKNVFSRRKRSSFDLFLLLTFDELFVFFYASLFILVCTSGSDRNSRLFLLFKVQKKKNK